MTRSKRIPLEDQVAALGDLPYADLVERWTKTHGFPPPKGIKRGLLGRSAAFTLQVNHMGGLSANGRSALRLAVRDYVRARLPADLGRGGGEALAGIGLKNTATIAVAKPRCAEPPPGSRLQREWHGQTHTVDVIAGGFRFEGTEYRSLSAIARKITGARWSGPRFFGL